MANKQSSRNRNKMLNPTQKLSYLWVIDGKDYINTL